MTLSKSELLELAEQVRDGTAHRETVPLPRLGGEVAIRPLSNPEASEVRRAQTRGINVAVTADEVSTDVQPGMNVSVDLAAMTDGEAEAQRLAAAYGLSCGGEEWKTSDLDALPDEDVAAIGKAVMRLSGIKDAKAQAKELAGDRFRSPDE